MNTETGEIRLLTDEQITLLNKEKPNLWVPIDKELERVLRKLSKKERKIVMARIKSATKDTEVARLRAALEKILVEPDFDGDPEDYESRVIANHQQIARAALKGAEE